MDWDHTWTWSITWYDKAMHQISNEYLYKAERKLGGNW
jgi:hypothetical protein